MGGETYWAEVHREARQRAWVTVMGSRIVIFSWIVGVAAIFVALWIYGSEDAVKDEIIAFIAVLIVTALLFGFVYLYFLITIPKEWDTEKTNKICSLEQELKPNVRIVFGAGPPFEQYDPGAYDYVGRRTFRVGVENIGNIVLERVQVKLVGMKRVSDGSQDFNKLLPMNLKRQHDNPSDILNIPHDQDFTLNPNDIEYVDIVTYKEDSRRTAPGEIKLCYALRGIKSMDYENSVPVDQYELEIKAVADQGDSDQRRFTVNVVDNDRLIFTPN